MESLAVEVRKLIYTIICFQCLIHLTEESAYRKYLKLFSYLLTMCICCNLIFKFANHMEESLREADRIYEEWEEEWQGLLSGKEDEIKAEHDEKRLWEEKIMKEAYEEYESRKGDYADVGETASETERDE